MPVMVAFWIGLLVGVVLTVPVVVFLAQRWVQRVRALEDRARTAERLAEFGTLTGGLAHEIKNPLSTVNLNAQLLSEDTSELANHLHDRAQAEAQIGRIQRRADGLTREVQRLRDILDDFLQFAGRMNLERADVNLNALLDELTTFFEPQAQAANVTVRTDLAADPDVVHVDADLLKQALLNLMINATRAMSSVRAEDAAPRELIVRTERRRFMDQDEVVVHVIDTGPGIPEDERDKVFQPYFSKTKGGTGLGLPRARRIIEEHGGHIALHSEVGRGTDFAIAFRAHDPAAAPDDFGDTGDTGDPGDTEEQAK